MTSMSPKTEGDDPDHILAGIQASVEKLNTELLGYKSESNGQGANSMGLRENNTIRQLLEQVLFEVQNLHPDFKDISKTGMGRYLTPAHQKITRNKLEFGEVKSTGEPIEAKTDAEYQSTCSNKIDDSLNRSQAKERLVDGVSIRGKTIESISQSITEDSFIIEISNFTDVNMDKLEYTWNAGSTLDLPQVIKSERKVALSIFDPTNAWLNGMLSYRICGTNLMLVVTLVQTNSHLAVALAPSDLPVANVLKFEVGEKYWEAMSDKRWGIWSKDVMEMVVISDGFAARARFTGRSKALLHLELCRVGPVAGMIRARKESDAQCNSIENVVSGKTNAGKTIAGISEYILESYGYIMEITNLLDVSLNTPVVFLENGSQPVIKPEMISGGGKEVMVVKMDTAGKGKGGLVSYRIGNTDLRLAIVFQLFNNGNKFGAAFVPASFATDATMQLFLTSDSQWKTSPDQQFVRAQDGEVVIQTRNIRARVTMTDTMKAILTVIIKTF